MVIYIHRALCRVEYIDMWMKYQLVEVFPESANIYWLLASPDGEIARHGDDIQSLHCSATPILQLQNNETLAQIHYYYFNYYCTSICTYGVQQMEATFWRYLFS